MADESKTGGGGGAAPAAGGGGAGDNALVRLFRTTNVDSFPFDGKVVEIDASSSVLDAFKAMVNSHISSAPVYNAATKKYEGFVSLADLVQLVVDAAAAVDVKTVGSMTKLGEVLSVDVTAPVTEVVNISANSPFIPVQEGTNLIAVASMLANSVSGGASVHRVPVVNADRRVCKIVAQSRVVQFLNENMPPTSAIMDKTVAELGLGMGRSVVTIGSSEPALKAFQAMVEHRISSVGVLDDEADVGKLVGQISTSDVLPVAGTGKFALVALPALEFITTAREIMDVVERRGRSRPGAITVNPTFTLRRVIERLAATKVHRVYVAESGRLVGIISLKDILKTVLLATGLESKPAAAAAAAAGGGVPPPMRKPKK